MRQTFFKLLSIVFLFTLFSLSQNSFAQLTGVKTVGGGGTPDYATIEAAIADLNTQGVGSGGVTFNVAAGHTESTTANLLITATGTAGNAIVFQKSGGGANPLVTRTDAGTLSTSTLGGQGDAVIIIQGSDYLTFDGIDVASDQSGIEYGYYLRKASVTDGCKFVTIKNAVIDMTKGTSAYVVGIYSSNNDAASLVSSATGITVSSTDGRNENVTITGNTIQDVFTGVLLRGFNHTASPYDFYDQNFVVGSSGAGNIIQNFAGNTASTAYGVYMIYHNGLSVGYNSINNTAGGGSGFTSIGYGIFTSTATSANVDIFENNITLNNTAASSSTYGISNSSGSTGVGNTVNIYNNTVENFNVTSTGSVYGIYNSASAETVNIHGNIVRNNTKTIAGTGSLSTYWLYSGNAATNGFANVYDNMVYGNTNSGGTGDVYCLYSNETSTVTKMVYNNSIYENEGPDDIFGLYTTLGTLAHVYGNNIYDITSTTTLTTSPYVSGIYISSGTAVYIYNNFISDLKAPNCAATDAIRGINIASATSSSTRNLYYNTIYLNASSSGTNFGSSGIYHIYSTTATTSTLDMRNNNIVNNSTPNGTGLTVAFRRSAATNLNNYNAISNNNNFYAGTAGASNLLFSDGTNNLQTIGQVKTHLTPGESASVAGNPPFVNSSTPPYDLHINTAIPTQLESAGTPISAPIAVATDYDGDTRNATTPDIGADEFNGIGADLTAPAITYNLLPNHSYANSSVSLTANITDASGVATGTNAPRFYLKKIDDVSYVFDNVPTIVGDDYTFTINYSAIGGVSIGDTIVYYVAAQDVNGNAATEPFGGSGLNPPGTVPPAVPNGYIITDLPMSGIYTVGLAAFKNATGKNVYFETRTRTVTKNINGIDAVEDINNVDGETVTEILNPDLSPRYETVIETYKELMENGKPFDTKFFQTPESRGLYPTLTAAVNDLNLRGVSGPVTFSLVDTYYPSETYPILITEVNGASSINTITIKPAAGIQAEIPGDTAQTAATIQIGYGDWVIIDGSNTIGGTTKDLKIVGLASGTIPSIHLWGDASNNVFKNLVVESQNSSTGSGTFLFGSGPFASDNNIVQNCTIKNIDTIATKPGVGYYYFSTNTGTGNQIIDCEVYNWNSYGLRLQGAPTTNTLVSGCDIYQTSQGSTSPYGIYISRVDGLIVEKCKIREMIGTSTVRGIYYAGNSTSGSAIFRNNFISISGTTNLTSGTIYGLDYLGSTINSFEAYHNSIYIGGTGVTTGTTYGITKRASATTYKVYDNAVHNARSNSSGTGKHYSVYVSNTTSTTFEMNYNDYFVDGTGGVFGYYSADVADLTSWQTASGQDANSLSVDPGFIGNDDLHIKSFINNLDGNGLYLASVPDDIDGDTRNVTTPDIGADEYTYVPPSVIDPTNVTATAISGDQIDVGFTLNASSDNVVIVYNLTGTFTTPSGTPPAPGNTFAGGTLIANTLTSPFSHTGLTPLTTYYYRLFSYDGVGYSFGVNANATTPCGVITEFSENFDGVSTPTLPDCWAKVGTSGSVYTQTTNNNTPPNCLYIYSTSTSNIAMVSLPPVSNAGAGTHWLKFYARGNVSVGGNLQIGYLTNPVDPLTFVAVDTVTMNSLTYELYTAFLGTAPGSNQYIAIRHPGSPASSILIDNVVWEAIPTTPEFTIDPTSGDFGTLVSGNTSLRNFTITNLGGGTLTIGSGDITITGTDASQFTLGSVTYPISLGMGQSEVITVTFLPTSAGTKNAAMEIVHNAAGSPATVSLTGTALPAGILFEDFTGTTFPPAGWTVANQDSGSQVWLRQTTSGYYLSPPASAGCRWESSTLQNDDWLITPKLVVSSGDSLVFWWRAYSATWTESMVIKVGTTNDPNGTWTDIDSIASNSTTWMRQSYNLSAYTGNVYIAFVNRGLNEFRIYMDDVVGPQVYVPAVDLALTDFYQSSGLPVPKEGNSFTDYRISVNPEFEGISKGMTSLIQSNIGSRSTDVNNSLIMEGNVTPIELLNNVVVNGVVENFGTNASSYNLEWTVGGTAQTTYTGPSVNPAGTDTASLVFTPVSQGTFFTTGSIVVTNDEVTGNNVAAPFRMRVYPDAFTRIINDRGDNVVDTWVGWGTSNPTERMKAGVRFTAPSNIKIAGVDAIVRTETALTGDFQIQVRAAGTDTLAPGAVLYSNVYTSGDYFAVDGDYMYFPFDDTAPTIASGSDYWITIKAPLGSLYPGAVHNNGFVAGRSFYEQFSDTTLWTPLVITTERAWIMRSVNVEAAGSTFQLSVDVANGWNMVSVPGLHPTDQNVTTWWSGKDPAAGVFRFASGYQSVTTVAPGIGYWMKHIGANTYNTGDEWPAGGIQIVPNAPLAGVTGWNLIGGYHLTVATSGITTTPGGLQSGSVFGYTPGTGYAPATNLVPGYGYWIKLTGAGDINIPTSLAKGSPTAEYIKSDWGRITLTDAAGKSYTLYAVNGDSPNGAASVNLNLYELPPVPPAGMFDVRYGSQRMAEVLGSEVQTIEMQGVEYPVTVRVEGITIRVQDETGKMVNAVLKPDEDVVISNPMVEKLKVSSNVIPETYSLEQNYPNPFNPSTMIEFSIPEDVDNVKLTIYDALGQKVAELVNGKLEAGRYSYQWDASRVATGLYIYQLQTDKFVSTKKMLLLK